MKRNLLVIAYAFPPSGGAGVRRILKMIKYLSEKDWNITVLSPQRGRYFAYPYDPLLLNEVPSSVRIVECFTPERWYMTRATSAGEGTKDSKQRRSSFVNFYRHLYKQIGNLLAVPESAITWLPFAVRRGLQLIQQNHIDAIFVTSPPFSSLLVGGMLKQMTGLPLVVEFRDAWIAEPTRAYPGYWRKRIESWQEAWAIKMADRVISVTDGVTRDFVKRYGSEQNAVKLLTIPNGYDSADLSQLSVPSEMRQPGSPFKIVYTGTLGDRRTPRYFLAGVQHLLQRCPDLASRLKIVFVGRNGRFMDGCTIEDYVEMFGLSNIVEIAGFVTRAESLRYQAQADLLLLLIGLVSPEESQCYGLSAKVFDYALTGKPILTIAEEGETASFVRMSGIGEIVSHYDTEGISASIERALKGNLIYAPDHNFVQTYDYELLSQRLNDVLLETVGEKWMKFSRIVIYCIGLLLVIAIVVTLSSSIVRRNSAYLTLAHVLFDDRIDAPQRQQGLQSFADYLCGKEEIDCTSQMAVANFSEESMLRAVFIGEYYRYRGELGQTAFWYKQAARSDPDPFQQSSVAYVWRDRLLPDGNIMISNFSSLPRWFVDGVRSGLEPSFVSHEGLGLISFQNQLEQQDYVGYSWYPGNPPLAYHSVMTIRIKMTPGLILRLFAWTDSGRQEMAPSYEGTGDWITLRMKLEGNNLQLIKLLFNELEPSDRATYQIWIDSIHLELDTEE